MESSENFIYIHTYIYIHTHIYRYKYIYISIYTYICKYIYMHIHYIYIFFFLFVSRATRRSWSCTISRLSTPLAITTPGTSFFFYPIGVNFFSGRSSGVCQIVQLFWLFQKSRDFWLFLGALMKSIEQKFRNKKKISPGGFPRVSMSMCMYERTHSIREHIL